MDEYTALLDRLNSLTGEVRKKALNKSLRKMGTVVQQAIKVRTPAQAGEYAAGALKPGELAGDIRVNVHVADDANAAMDQDRVTIGPSRKTEYVARFVETGHKTRPRKKPKRTPKVDRVQAHPFVRPAFDSSKDQAIAVFEEEMVAAIQEAMNA